MEQKTGMAVNQFLSQPTESTKQIINDYFTEMMHSQDDLTALTGFEIVHINTANLQDVKVTVRLQYDNDLVFPPREYSIVPINKHYQVRKQYCAYYLNQESNTNVQLRGCTYESTDNGISIQS